MFKKAGSKAYVYYALSLAIFHVSGPEDSSQSANNVEECAEASDGELKSEPASTAAAAGNAARAVAAARAAARRREEEEDLKRKCLEQEAVGETSLCALICFIDPNKKGRN